MRILLACLAVGIVLGCEPSASSTPPSPTSGPTSGPTSSAMPTSAALRSPEAADERLVVHFEIRPEVREERVPMRDVVLHFRNPSSEPVRFYLPRSAPFRAGISSVSFRPEGHPPLFVPEPRPHGYVVTEADFHLLAPGESKTFTQPFTLDPMMPGKGTATQRRPGFADGATVKVSWTYENTITKWEGGAQTLDGVTKPLFGGETIPHIWTGELTTTVTWTVR